MEDFVTAKQIVDELGIRNHQARRWAYKQIKNMLKAKYPDKWEEYIVKDEKNKRHVAFIPTDFAETVKENLIKMRTVKKKEIVLLNGRLQEKTVEYTRW